MKIIKYLKFANLIAIMFIISMITGCFSDGGSSGDSSGGGGGSTVVGPILNVEVTGLSADKTDITISWDDPASSGLTNIDVTCSNGSNVDIDPGTEINVFTGLTANTDYDFTFICEYSNGEESEEKVFFVTTAPSSATGPVIHIPIATAVDFIDEIDNGSGLDGNYLLTDDLDLSVYQTGTGWTPIGNVNNTFSGTFNGNGYNIIGLFINSTQTSSPYSGFFGSIEEARISNVHIIDGEVRAVNGSTGGLVGYAKDSNIINCSFSGVVEGSIGVGGLVGSNATNLNEFSICFSYSTGSVIGKHSVGGLVGYNGGGISNSYSNCTVNGKKIISDGLTNVATGGLVGRNQGGIVQRCYSSGPVEGFSYVGGIIGSLSYSGKMEDSYATGSVNGVTDNVGGITGNSYYSTYNVISNCYSLSVITGSGNIGGAIGTYSTGTFSNLYWNITINSSLFDIGDDGDVAAITGLSTAQMKDAQNFSGFDFSASGEWDIDGTTNDGYPFLRNMP